MSGASGLRPHTHLSAGQGGTLSGIPPGEVTGSLLMDEQGSDPSAPAAAKWLFYVKSGGLYARNNAGTVIGPLVDGPFSKIDAATWQMRSGVDTITGQAGASDAQLGLDQVAGLQAATGKHVSLLPNAGADGGGTDSKVYIVGGHGIVLNALASDPSGANSEAGQAYYNSASNKVRWYNGSAWADVGAGSGLSDPMTTRGDSIIRNSSNTTARLAVGAANRLMGSDGTDPSWRQATESDLNLTDVTTGNVVSTKHGFAPKSPADATQFLNGAATPAYAAVKDSDLATTDVTTNNVSTSKHGFAPKAPNDATKFLDGTGAYASLPAGAGTRVYNSGAFSVGASSETAVTFDTERSDSDAFHSTSSNTSRLTVPTGKDGRYAIAGTVEWAASALGTLRRLSIRINGTTYIAKDEITSIINAALPQNVETVYDLVAGDYVELVAFQDTVGSINLQASGNYSPEFGMMLAGVSAASSGTTYGQAYPYPTTFSGDSEDMSSAANWTDVSAFSTKEILNSTILHLVTLGASHDHRVRKTLGTTKAAAFDFRFSFMPALLYWSTTKDVYFEIVLRATGGGSVIAIARISPRTSANGFVQDDLALEVGTTAVVTTNIEQTIPVGARVWLRIARDGSNVLTFQHAVGLAPGYFTERVAADNTLYAPTSSGTVAEVDFSIHTPSGPGSTVNNEAFIDTFESV